jgi:ankyrin repeat protein
MLDSLSDGAPRARAEPVSTLGHLAREGNLDQLALAIGDHIRPDHSSFCGWTALADAAWGGHSEAVRLLLNAGLDVDTPTLDGLTPLMIASSRGHLNVVRMLCAQGARVDRRSRDGRTAVESALQSGQVEVAAQLHRQGATFDGPLATLYVRAICAEQGTGCALIDPTEQMARGASVWRWVMARPLKLTTDLLQPIASCLSMPPQLTTTAPQPIQRLRFRTPVEFVVDSNHPALRSAHTLPSRGWRYRAGWTEHVQAVLHGEVGPDTPDQFGYIPLLEAIRNGAAEAVRALVAAGATVNRVPHYGCMRGATMLINAAEKGDPDIISTLVDAGAGINVETPSGWTALMVAASRGHEDAVRVLVNAGADLDIRNAQGQTALALAQRRRHPQVARLLLVANNGLRLLPRPDSDADPQTN